MKAKKTMMAATLSAALVSIGLGLGLSSSAMAATSGVTLDTHYFPNGVIFENAPDPDIGMDDSHYLSVSMLPTVAGKDTYMVKASGFVDVYVCEFESDKCTFNIDNMQFLCESANGALKANYDPMVHTLTVTETPKGACEFEVDLNGEYSIVDRFPQKGVTIDGVYRVEAPATNPESSGTMTLQKQQSEKGQLYSVEINTTTGMDTCEFAGQCSFRPDVNIFRCFIGSFEDDSYEEIVGSVDVEDGSITFTSSDTQLSCGLRGSMLFKFNLQKD